MTLTGIKKKGELSVLVKNIKCLLFHLEAKISSYANLELSMRGKY
jgi:hypothetical protein